ncbi:MAG: tetratricopeptide repeat protein [Labilithrix sp.]|nr:tetratricopeptide repeat protein [Labilithrix sp.]
MKRSAHVAAALGLLAGAGGLAVLAARQIEPSPGATTQPLAGAVEATAATFVGADRCADCHADEARAWRGSDHANAMARAEGASVAGDFEDRSFVYAGTTTSLRRRGERLEVTTDGADGGLATFPVDFTLGARPLQQYLVPFGGGRWQALPVAWDTRSREDGGRRWFSVYANDTTTSRDALHWTGPSQNWNAACAECHVTSFQKNYRAANRTYETAYSELGVSCEACHGPGSRHLAWAARSDRTRDEAAGFAVRLGGDTFAWSFDGKAIASRVEPLRAGAAQVETCARCHSRRTPIWSELDPRAPLTDSHRAALLEEGLYFPDGQIEEEVYEYASFLQSKMHGRGVVCTNCHDPHSGATRQDGNGLCHSCHAPAAFDTPAHTKHRAGSPGSRCVECHMPARIYMRVDARRDHSLRVPRPDLAVELGVPDACTAACHSGKGAAWSARAARQLYGAPRRPRHWGTAIAAGRRFAADAQASLLDVVRDASTPAIARATALELLARYPAPATIAEAERGARDPDPLVRRAAIPLLEGAPEATRRRALDPLLVDARRTVRLAAVSALAGQRGAPTGEPMARAIEEARASFAESADRADARVDLANLERRLGRRDAAERELRAALELQPTFVPAYVNLADLLREAGRDDEGRALLERGLALAPDSAALHRALGLALVRGRRTREALDHLAKSSALAPDDPAAGYVWAVALHDTGDRAGAVRLLTDAARRFPAHEPTRAALAAYAGERR